MPFLTGTGRHRAQIVYFFWMQIGSRAPSELGLGSGSRLHRMRQCLGLPRELWIENIGGSWSRAVERKGPCLYVCTDGSRRACAVGDCPRLVSTLGDPRETSGPRIDRFSLVLASTKTLASICESGRTATKRASSTRSEGEIRVPRPLSMAWLFSPRHRRGNLKPSQRISQFREVPCTP